MIEAHVHEWLNLLIRWIHMIVGIAWIGASFYFNWLENNLERKPPLDEGIAGNLWAVHGGGFYHLKKFSTGPAKLPSPLHWFKWEAYTTWLSGISLLVVVYYFNARAFLLDPSVNNLTPWQGIAAGIGSLVVSWFVYDLLCRSPLKQRPLVLTALILGWFVFLAWALSETFSGRAAYIHVGAAIGTVMVANVFFVIIPAQKEMVSALASNRPPDPSFGKNGLLRSRHNNYLTLPVLFTMVSSHFPSTYGHTQGWIVLVLLSLVGVLVRHYFNIRHLRSTAVWILPGCFIAMVTIMWFSAPSVTQRAADQAAVSDQQIVTIMQTRCASCHSATPSQAGFAVAPKGILLEDISQVRQHKDKVFQTTVVTRIMPLGNLTGIEDQERDQIKQWFEAQ
jgi:uncharacterized membrane protein